jgi:hypothetical protein
MAVTVLKNLKESKSGNPASHLKNCINYILNPEKTRCGMLIGSNCGITANEIYKSMIETKQNFMKEWGRQGYHFVISFPPNVATVEQTMEVAKQFCEEYLSGFDYVFAVHDDHDHKHAHIVFNSVNHIDGYKYRYTKGDWEKEIQPITDKICKQMGLPCLEFEKNGKRVGKSYAEHSAIKDNRFTISDIIKMDINMAISQSSCIDEFFQKMKSYGYNVRIGTSKSSKHPGEYVAYTPPSNKKEKRKAHRDYNLGVGYSLNEIKIRINKENTYKESSINMMQPFRLRISKLKPKQEFQFTFFVRCEQAVYFQSFNFSKYENARARDDLLKINDLTSECELLINKHIYSIESARAELQKVNDNLKVFTSKKYYEKHLTDILTSEEINARKEYANLKETLERNEKKLSDKDYEVLCIRMEELEDLYGFEVLSNTQNISDNEVMQRLREEKRLLLQIINDAEINADVRLLAMNMNKTKKQDNQINKEMLL